jgi:uncharacterized membrane protein
MNYSRPFAGLLKFRKWTRFLCWHWGIALQGIVAFTLFTLSPAAADFRLCNNTSSRIGVAIGHKAQRDWNTAGWWTLDPNKCESLLVGKLATRYFYVHAVDYDRGGAWLGKAFMCINNGDFVIYGADDCSVRGHDRSEFFEVDTRNQSDWTIQLNKASKFFIPGIAERPTR